MKKIIKGKLYNTETAKHVGNDSWGSGDFCYVEEHLYRKKTGEFFLHGVGGAMTVYGCPDNGGWRGGEDIIPIGDLEAKEWAEAHCDVDTYIELFGPVEE